jgi:hypothetical protein
MLIWSFPKTNILLAVKQSPSWEADSGLRAKELYRVHNSLPLDSILNQIFKIHFCHS